MERWNLGRRTLLYLAAAGSVEYIFRNCPDWLQAVGWGILMLIFMIVLKVGEMKSESSLYLSNSREY